MESKVREGHAPAVVISLETGERITSEAGAMMFISGEIDMDVEMAGGVMQGLRRKVLAGESLFLTTYTARSPGAVGLCGPFPGSIREHRLDGDVICEKHAYLAHHGDVTIEPIVAARSGMGIGGGGEGMILQRISGDGTVWLHGGGDFLDFELAAGQALKVDTGCMVMIDAAVRYDVTRQGGLAKSVFGGEGLFVVTLTGPGHVTLQTLPFSRTARAVREAAGGGQGERSGGGMLSSIISG